MTLPTTCRKCERDGVDPRPNPEKPGVRQRLKQRFQTWYCSGCVRFGIKAGIALGLMVSASEYLADRYAIAYDSQQERCIKDYRLFAVDRHDRVLERGAIYAFEAQGVTPVFEDGETLAKYLVGMPGDTIEITPEQRVLINGIERGDTLEHADAIGMTPSDFFGTATLGQGEYWFMGDSQNSFDSRYWGHVEVDQIIGRAHGIF